MMMGLGRFFLLFSFLLVNLGCSADSATQKKSEIDRLFANYTNTTPGCALGIFKNGAAIYRQGYGMANLKQQVPLTPFSMFEIASVSKHFTSVAMLLLEEQGKLRLLDSITRYVPELPQTMSKITILHLLHHTSGIADYLELAKEKNLGDYFTEQKALELIVNSELEFAPNDKHQYSNSGYFLLSRIVKKVTGKSLRQFAEQYMFRSLSMGTTHYHDRNTEKVNNLALGYYYDGSQYQEYLTQLEMVGDGGLYTSIQDFEKWDKNFYFNRLGFKGNTMIASLLEPGKLNDGTVLPYAKGLRLGTFRGRRVHFHGGSFVGYRAGYLRIPEERLSVALLCNRYDVSPVDIAFEIAGILLKR